MAKLTAKQEKFINEYLIDLNATQAAIRAGYSPASARQIAEKLMSKADIFAQVEILMADRAKRTGVNQDRIVRELAKIAFVNPPDAINMNEATIKDLADENDTAAILSVKVKIVPTKNGEMTEREIKMHDKVKALELLGKHNGMFKDKVELTGKDGGAIQTESQVKFYIPDNKRDS